MRALCVRSAYGVHIRIDHVTHRYIKHLLFFDGSFIPVVLKEERQEANAQEKALNLQRQKKAACPPPPPQLHPKMKLRSCGIHSSTQDEAAPPRGKTSCISTSNTHTSTPRRTCISRMPKIKVSQFQLLTSRHKQGCLSSFISSLHIIDSPSREAQKAQDQEERIQAEECG